MFRTLSLLFIFFFFVSCGKSGGGNNSTATGDAVALEEIQSAGVPQAALNFDVNIKLDNFNSSQEDKILIAADLIKKVVATEEFKTKILNHRVNGKKTFIDNGGLTNAEIYKKILEGSEKLRPGADNEMDLDLEVFRGNDDTVGYTYPHVIKVWMNEKFLNRHAPYKVTTNMMHEWLHKLGFKHAQERTPTRKYSVPYAVGYLVAEIAKKYTI